MKFLDEYRNPEEVRKVSRAIGLLVSREWTIMEVCGGQTHSILKYGITDILPEKVKLLHGPGCPVCVTAIELIDKAIELALRPDVILCSFGDMLRVPGSVTDLLSVKAKGADVRIVYSPLDAVKIAELQQDKEVVFFAVGFETTAPANALAVLQAERAGLKNFSLLVSHVLVPPAIELILSSQQNRVNGFLAAGHVCTVTGYHEYERISSIYKVPIVVTGFEPLDILQGLYRCLKQLEEGKAMAENAYGRSVKREGNIQAMAIMREVFHIVDRKWRGIGIIPSSGLGLSPRYSRFDAELRFGLKGERTFESPDCIAGLVLMGAKRPDECPVFGTKCTPEHPLGAPMVSSEGACSAYYRYKSVKPGHG